MVYRSFYNSKCIFICSGTGLNIYILYVAMLITILLVVVLLLVQTHRQTNKIKKKRNLGDRMLLNNSGAVESNWSPKDDSTIVHFHKRTQKKGAKLKKSAPTTIFLGGGNNFLRESTLDKTPFVCRGPICKQMGRDGAERMLQVETEKEFHKMCGTRVLEIIIITLKEYKKIQQVSIDL